MTETAKTSTAQELLAKAQAAKLAKEAEEASNGVEPNDTEDAEPTVELEFIADAYQLPIAPATVWFKDPAGNKYKRIFPDGVATPENAHEKETLDAMLKVGNCYRAIAGAKGAFQKAPPPVGA